MKNILLVTPLYPIPSPENNATPVCHYFTREWVKMGYNVRVLHFQPVHCEAWHLLVKCFGKALANWAGGGNFYAKKLRKAETYDMEGVKVTRIPVYNFIPHGRYPEKSIGAFCKKAWQLLEEEGFVPDIITGHMLEIEVIPELNSRYNAKTCMVSHGCSPKTLERYPEWKELTDSYTIWGFRSEAGRMEHTNLFGAPKNTFICHSGIPPTFIEGTVERNFDSVTNFVFVGEMIERKHPEILQEAIPACFDNYSITFVGDGPMEQQLKDNNDEHCIFTGKTPRNQITTILDHSDCFIMASEGEAYGLVYIEAMARGCITIAAKDEGMDGVIVDGTNGFLCKAGDAGSLMATLERIKALSPEERKAISSAAIRTASEMTDFNMAQRYANVLESL